MDDTATGTAETGTAETGTAETGTAETGTAETVTADTELSPLTPRPGPRSQRARRSIALLVVVGVAAAVSVLITNLLGDASLFFYNADEAVERRDELASERFSLQGTPIVAPVNTFWDDRPVLAFSVSFNGAVVDVVHIGDPAELFQPGVPVVLEGAWQQGPGPGPVIAEDGWHFASDRMLVKHDNDYRNRDSYEERIDEAEEGASLP